MAAPAMAPSAGAAGVAAAAAAAPPRDAAAAGGSGRAPASDAPPTTQGRAAEGGGAAEQRKPTKAGEDEGPKKPLWTTPQLDTFCATVAGLPHDLRANLKRVRELDLDIQTRKGELYKRARDLLVEAVGEDGGVAQDASTSAAPAPPIPSEEQEGIAQGFAHIVKQSEHKYAIASATYDLVDQHTCRLDAALRSLEDELASQRRIASLYEPKAGSAGRGGGAGRGAGRGRAKQGAGRGGGGLFAEAAAMAGVPHAGLGVIGGGLAAAGGPLIDVKVDPSEPTYCYCGGISHGQMVGCDNDDCPWEWFHIACVGILPHNMPKGTWYCPECRKSMGRK